MRWRCCCMITQLCLALGNTLACHSSASSVTGLSWASILGWAAISFSRGSFWLRGQAQVACIADGYFTIEPPGKLDMRWWMFTKLVIVASWYMRIKYYAMYLKLIQCCMSIVVSIKLEGKTLKTALILIKIIFREMTPLDLLDMCWQGCEWKEILLHCWCWWEYKPTSTTTLENSMDWPQKIKSRIMWSINLSG